MCSQLVLVRAGVDHHANDSARARKKSRARPEARTRRRRRRCKQTAASRDKVPSGSERRARARVHKSAAVSRLLLLFAMNARANLRNNSLDFSLHVNTNFIFVCARALTGQRKPGIGRRQH